MRNSLHGRNLAHVGCTLGLLTGLLVGLVVGIVIITLVQTASAADIAGLAWLGVTFALGAAGYGAGSALTRRLWGDASQRAALRSERE